MVRPDAGYSFHYLNPDTGRFLDDVMAGLSRPQKALPPKYFYDARGCALFEAICGLPEYYLTRAEIALMRGQVGGMARHLGPGCVLIEYGSGRRRQTRRPHRATSPGGFGPERH